MNFLIDELCDTYFGPLPDITCLLSDIQNSNILI